MTTDTNEAPPVSKEMAKEVLWILYAALAATCGFFIWVALDVNLYGATTSIGQTLQLWHATGAYKGAISVLFTISIALTVASLLTTALGVRPTLTSGCMRTSRVLAWSGAACQTLVAAVFFVALSSMNEGPAIILLLLAGFAVPTFFTVLLSPSDEAGPGSIHVAGLLSMGGLFCSQSSAEAALDILPQVTIPCVVFVTLIIAFRTAIWVRLDPPPVVEDEGGEDEDTSSDNAEEAGQAHSLNESAEKVLTSAVLNNALKY